MSYPRAVKGVLDTTMTGSDDICGNGADKGIKRFRTDRVYDTLARLFRIKARRGELFGQHSFIIRPDLRTAHMVGAVASSASDVCIDWTGA